MIAVYAWLAVMGIAPFAWPDHSLDDLWFPADLLAHAVGLAGIGMWAKARWAR